MFWKKDVKNKKILNTALAGTGPMAGRYAGYIHRHPGMKLVIGHSHDKGRAEESSRRFEVPFETEIQRVLEMPGLDMIVIASAPYQHEAQVFAAIDRKIPVICEKPVITDMSRLDVLYSRVCQGVAPVECVFQKRLNRTTAMAAEFIKKTPLGRIKHVRARSLYSRARGYYDHPRKGKKELSGGGALITQGIHALDLLLFLFGEAERAEGEIRCDRFHDIEVEDTADVRVFFKSGITAELNVTTASEKPHEEIEIVCEGGSLTFGPHKWGNRPWRYRSAKPEETIHEFYLKMAGADAASSPAALWYNTHRLVADLYKMSGNI